MFVILWAKKSFWKVICENWKSYLIYHCWKVRASTSAQSAPSERSFQCVAVCHAQNPNNNSTRSFLVFLHAELAILEREFVCYVLVQHQREDLLKQSTVRVALHILAAVNENVVLPRMSVHITIQRYWTIFHQSNEGKDDKILMAVALRDAIKKIKTKMKQKFKVKIGKVCQGACWKILELWKLQLLSKKSEGQLFLFKMFKD